MCVCVARMPFDVVLLLSPCIRGQLSAGALVSCHLMCLGSGLNMLRFSLLGSGVPVKGDIQPTQQNEGLQSVMAKREHEGRAFFQSTTGESAFLGLSNLD